MEHWQKGPIAREDLFKNLPTQWRNIMTTARFDTLYFDHIQGEIADPVVKDLDGTPNYVLELDRPCTVELEWQLESNAPGSHPVDLIDGTWEVKVSVESIGKGMEDEIANANVPLAAFTSSSPALRTWQHTFNIAANTIKDEAVYRIGTLITYRDPSGNRRAMAGFSEGPLVTFYKD
jgi:hypothetical protein